MAAVHQTARHERFGEEGSRAMAEQLRAHTSKVATTQREMLRLRDEQELMNRKHQRAPAAERIEAFHFWMRSRRLRAFCKWKGATE